MRQQFDAPFAPDDLLGNTRFDLKHSIILGLGIVLALALGSGAMFGSQSGFSLEPARAESSDQQDSALGVSVNSEETGAVQTEKEQATVCVHVGGCVVSSGVYDLPLGSRVSDGIAAAGGLADGAASDAINQARLLNDGEQIIVPSLDDLDGHAGSGAADNSYSTGSTTGSLGLVNLNTANASQLETLPGIGPSTAQKIISDREANGPFSKPDDLKRVSGIGDKKYEALASLICI